MHISLSQAFAQWQSANTDIPYRPDRAALAESWNNYTDSLAKNGELCALQYHYAPAYDEPMPGGGSRYDALADDRAFILDAMGVGLVAAFVPFSQSRSKGEKSPSLNWRVTLRYRGRSVIETDYRQGCAHAPAYNNPAVFPGKDRKRDQHATAQNIRRECETGLHCGPGMNPRATLDAPALVDVMHSLLLDGSAIDARDFAYWASDYGMDEDSIKARAMYDACVATGLALRAAFGGQRFEELRELFEGM